MCLLFVCSLYNNAIGNEGATAIAEALKVNAVLTNLDLSSNYIGGYYDSHGKLIETPEGPTAIAEALKVNAVLTTLK